MAAQPLATFFLTFCHVTATQSDTGGGNALVCLLFSLFPQSFFFLFTTSTPLKATHAAATRCVKHLFSFLFFFCYLLPFQTTPNAAHAAATRPFSLLFFILFFRFFLPLSL
jgi:hypothetical protein